MFTDTVRLVLGIASDSAHASDTPDELISVMAACTRTEGRASGHLRIETLCAIALLCTSSKMGPERYEELIRRPLRFQCRTDPRRDPELQHMPYPAMLLAWAAKYAHRAVIVAAPNKWRPDDDAAAIAKERQIQIAVIPLSAFSRDYVKRLRHFHFVSQELKTHARRDEIVMQLIE